jgi:hypothetical protein
MSELKALIAQGEHQQLDFKFRIDDSKKIARTLCAFANTDGGRLLIGVKDNGKIAGVDPNEEIHMIQAAVEMYCSPKLEFEHRVWQEDMKLVLDIWVPKSEKRPVMAFNEEGKLRAYVRVEDSTLLANKILLGVWKREHFKEDRPQHFGENEIELLKNIPIQGITVSKLYRTVQLSKRDIDNLLIRLVSWELVQMTITETETLYSVPE